jgi:hypothetical protein
MFASNDHAVTKRSETDKIPEVLVSSLQLFVAQTTGPWCRF